MLLQNLKVIASVLGYTNNPQQNAIGSLYCFHYLTIESDFSDEVETQFGRKFYFKIYFFYLILFF